MRIAALIAAAPSTVAVASTHEMSSAPAIPSSASPARWPTPIHVPAQMSALPAAAVR